MQRMFNVTKDGKPLVESTATITDAEIPPNQSRRAFNVTDASVDASTSSSSDFADFSRIFRSSMHEYSEIRESRAPG